MHRPADDAAHLFQRWSKRGEAQALGELFDRTAPQLLKLAIHLVGDASAAEDLVQATFLALIEQRERIDAARPIEPWLAGVLTNKARELRRSARRVVDPARLEQRLIEDASAPAERRELQGEVARAIDSLDEPYRQVVLLSLRHAMAPADIAHVLDRDAGTVRVQLHRGLEKLRKLLPAALATSLVLAVAAPRGLAAVKAHVLEQALLATPVAASATLIGGLIVSKLAVAVAALLFVALSWFLMAQQGGSSASPHREAAREPLAEVVREPQSATATAPATPSVDEERSETPAAASARWTVEVVDAITRAPLGGAEVTRSQARTTNVPALLRERPAHFAMRNDGRLEPRTRGDWPALAGTSEPAFAGRAPLLALDTTEGAEVLARTTTDAAGRATLEQRPDTGLVEVQLAGYAPRARPVVDGRLPARIELWPLRRIRGRCGFLGSEARDKTFDLVIATRAPSVEGGTREGVGVFRARSEADGSFSAEVAGAIARVDVLSHGWRPVHDVQYDVDDNEWIVTLAAQAVLRFLDAADRTPIESVHAVAHHVRHGFAAWASALHAPDGYLTLPAPQVSVDGDSKAKFKFWTPEHRAVLWTTPKSTPEAPIEVLLEREEQPSLAGHILRDGQALDDAIVTLYAHGANLVWEPRQVLHTMLVDSTQTHAGRFVVTAPSGAYLLEVQAGDTRHTRVVQLPAPQELVIDLARLATVTVEVVDRAGAPQFGHIVALNAGDQRTDRRRTDERGLASFGELPSLEGSVFAPNVNTDSSFGADVAERIVLGDGEQLAVKLVVRGTDKPRHARVVSRGTSDYSGWRVRFGEQPWQELSSQGVIPMDLATEEWTAKVVALDGRRWGFDIPKNADDGHVIELDGGDGRLHGMVRVPAGEPLTGWTLYAQPWSDCSGASTARAMCELGADGRFELSGLAPCTHRLQLHDSDSKLRAEFTPAAPPASDTKPLEILLDPPRGELRLSGVVRRKSGSPVAGALLMVESITPGADGALRILGKEPLARTDEQGRYSIALPRTAQHEISVFAEHGRSRAAQQTVLDDGRAQRALDFEIE